MLDHIRQVLIGPPLPSEQAGDERLGNLRALAALSPDALASIAYANQEIAVGLAAAGAVGLTYAFPIALAIAALLAVLALSYTQVIAAYPGGGGSYTVARENLGVHAGLVAAAALLIDYTLNVAVSVTAGVAAAASAFPLLWAYRTPLALLLLVIITVVNLRGLRESGGVTAGPVYLFIGTYLLLIGVGIVRIAAAGAPAAPPSALLPGGTIAAAVLLRTFAAGCTALTGIESISNGVPIFRPPETRHATQTMATMAALMAVLFVGTVGLTQLFGLTPSEEETILSALARRVLGGGALYYVVQGATLLVLMVAANTSFVGFPRLASVVAQDAYLPRQLTMLGERLVFSNGILMLSGLAGLLVVIFNGDTHLLIPLFAVGAFLAFTLSQAGMVRHWLRVRGPGWPLKAAANSIGVLATGLALAIIGVTKFLAGAWIVVLLIPLFVLGFRQVKQHYAATGQQLTLRSLPPPSLKPLARPRIVVPVSGLHRGVVEALRYARSISDDVTAVHVTIDPARAEKLRHDWAEWGLDDDVKLVLVESPYRALVGPFLAFLDAEDHTRNDGHLASVMLPEFVPARWWHALLHNQTAWLLRLALLFRRRRYGFNRAIIDVPYILRR